MRVHVVDPPAYTPPYDHALCRALAAAGAEVELYTSRFAYGSVAPAEGYRRRELFYRGAGMVAGAHPGKPRGLPRSDAAEERLHGLVQPEGNVRQPFAIDCIQVRIIGSAFHEACLPLCKVPALPGPQPHHQPIVEAPALAPLMNSRVAASCSLTSRRIFLALSIGGPAFRKNVLQKQYSTAARGLQAPG